jgi:CHAT domain-containing protein
MKYWLVAPLMVATLGVVGAQTPQLSGDQTRQIVDQCPLVFSVLGESSPLPEGRDVTIQETPALRQFAFRRNRQQIFEEAARIYGRIAYNSQADQQSPAGGAAANARPPSPTTVWEAEALRAVNISNLGRTIEAETVFASLAANPVGQSGLRPAQLALFRAINAAQTDADLSASQANLDRALAFAREIPALLRGAGAAGGPSGVVAADGTVQIDAREAELFNQSVSEAAQKTAFASTLGRRPLTESERAAIIQAQGAWLEARVHLLKAAAVAPQQRGPALDAAAAALINAETAARGFGANDALWLQALIQGAVADLALARNKPADAVAASEWAVVIVARYVSQDSSSAPIVASVRRTLAQAYLASGEPVRARQQFRCAFDISARASALAPITTREVEPYLNTLFADASAGNPEAQAEFFRVASSASDGAARDVQAQSALWLSQGIERQPALREILRKERELNRLTARLDSAEIRAARRDDPGRVAIVQGIAALQADLRVARQNAGFDPGVAIGGLGLGDLAQPFIRERGLSALVAVQAAQASLSSVRAALRAQGDEAFLMHFVGERSVYGVAVTRDATRVFRVQGDAAAIVRDARTYTERLLPFVARDGRRFTRPMTADPAVGRVGDMFDLGVSLYDQLLPAEVRPMLSRAQNLVVNSQGALAELPFAALLTRQLTDAEKRAIEPRGQAPNYGPAPWVAKEVGVSVAVSASAFPLTRNLPPRVAQNAQAIAFTSSPDTATPPSQQDIDAIADALLRRIESQARTMSAVDRNNCREELRSILSLPTDVGLREGAISALQAFDPNINITQALREGAQFNDAALIGPRPADGAQPAESQPAQAGDLSRYRLIYFGAHGGLPTPGSCLSDPFLVTTLPTLAQAQASKEGMFDGLLTASEIFGLNLDADLVVLAACNTGQVRRRGAGQTDAEARQQEIGRFGLDGRGVVGTLAQSFLVAGARSVLVTHWEVGKDATQQYMKDFFGALAQPGVTYAEAMSRAQRAQIDSGRFSHPYFWAPFVFVGDGQRPFRTAVG